MADDARPKLYPNPFVTALHFTNFMALADLKIQIRSRFVVLVGANAVGKSSVLRAVELHSRAVANQKSSDQELFARLRTRGSKEMRSSIRVETQAGDLTIGLDGAAAQNEAWRVSSRTLGWAIATSTGLRARTSKAATCLGSDMSCACGSTSARQLTHPS